MELFDQNLDSTTGKFDHKFSSFFSYFITKPEL
jgi:hypothetical protein